jgi:hypothetical protein
MNYEVVTGTIEVMGNEANYPEGSVFSVIRFTDGQTLRNVYADGGLAPYLVQNAPVSLAVVNRGKNRILVGLERDDVGFRGANPDQFMTNRGKQIFWILVFGALSVIALLALLSNGIFNPMGLFGLLLASPFFAALFFSIAAVHWSESITALIKSLEQRGSVAPPAVPTVPGALAAASS